MIMEAEMSRDLQSVAGDQESPYVVPVQRLGVMWCWKSQCFSPQSGKASVPAGRQPGRRTSLLLMGGQPVCSMQVFNGLDAPPHIGEGDLLYLDG